MIGNELREDELFHLNLGDAWVEVKLPCRKCRGKGHVSDTRKGLVTMRLSIPVHGGKNMDVVGCDECGGNDTKFGKGYVIRPIRLSQLKRVLT